METKVQLQDSYHFLPIIVLLMILLILAAIALQIIFRIKYRKNADRIKVHRPAKKTLPIIKSEYIGKMDNIYQNLMNRTITVREGYHMMSCIIREFVKEVTGINVDSYTLKEIRRVNIPELTQLMQEYYVPEFAERTHFDVMNSLQKTRSVIERWI